MMSEEEFQALLELIDGLIHHHAHANEHRRDITRHQHDGERYERLLNEARERLVL